ncbi:MAG: radical SAM protein [Candidatus Omnitrophica bacterium]|nr:radical SAM protein [Candidatus Omnitrophota bacterium]
MNYIYGPVKSRRLSSSLGLNITPYKFCVLNCVYCQLKNTTKFTLNRREYVRANAVLSELDQFLKNYPDYKKVDYITISGSGEPLLNSTVKDIISGIKKFTTIPVALITNSVLLTDARTRGDILNLDLVLPSLDAVTQDKFEKINRPFDSNIKIEDIINALIALRREFKGKIWLEIMIIKDINDDLEYIKKFKEVIQKINPDKVQLNIPSRPPSESWVKIPSAQKLSKIQSILGEGCELI